MKCKNVPEGCRPTCKKVKAPVVEKEVAKPVIMKAVKPQIVGGPGSLPPPRKPAPKPVLKELPEPKLIEKKVEAPKVVKKRVEAPKVVEKKVVEKPVEKPVVAK